MVRVMVRFLWVPIRYINPHWIMADYGGLWWIMADYGGLWRIMADYGGLWTNTLIGSDNMVESGKIQ